MSRDHRHTGARPRGWVCEGGGEVQAARQATVGRGGERGKVRQGQDRGSMGRGPGTDEEASVHVVACGL